MTFKNDTIAPRATIAFLFGASETRDALTELAEPASYRVVDGNQNSSVDVGVIDLRSDRVTVRRAAAICEAFRRNSPEATVLFIVSPAAMHSMAPSLKRFGEALPSQASLDQVLARIREILRIRNIAEETGERLKTLTSLNRAVEFPIISTDASPPRVLIVGAPGPSAMAAINLLSGVADICACVLTAGQAMRALDHQTFDVALFLPARDDGAIPALIRALRRHPKFARTALIEIVDSAEDMADAARRGGVDFLLKSQISAAISTRVTAAARRARLVYSMREFLRACAGEGVRDSASGVFTPTFLGQHGSRIAARAVQTGRPLSVVAARLNDPAGEDASATRAALKQAAKLIGRITRAEDLTARIAPDTFTVILPSTHLEDANRVGLRIDGVLSNTAFHMDRTGRAQAMSIDISVAQHLPSASLGETISVAVKPLFRTKPRPEQPNSAPLQQSPQ